MLDLGQISDAVNINVVDALEAFYVEYSDTCEDREISAYITMNKKLVTQASQLWDLNSRVGEILSASLLLKIKNQFDFNFYSDIVYEMQETDDEYKVTATITVDTE